MTHSLPAALLECGAVLMLAAVAVYLAVIRRALTKKDVQS